MIIEKFLVNNLYEELACVLLLSHIDRLAPQLEAFPEPGHQPRKLS
jgi:hypothetical protein